MNKESLETVAESKPIHELRRNDKGKALWKFHGYYHVITDVRYHGGRNKLVRLTIEPHGNEIALVVKRGKKVLVFRTDEDRELCKDEIFPQSFTPNWKK